MNNDDYEKQCKLDKRIVDLHRLYYESRVWDSNTRWIGTRIQKCPLDSWIYQEIIHDKRPDVIIETGTGYGGGTLFLANILDIVNNGTVVSIDREFRTRPEHSRIKYLTGMSTSEDIIKQVARYVEGKSVMVILDSDHTRHHVLSELEKYSEFVTKGNYIIVEDTNINPLAPDGTMLEGPYLAVVDFIRTHNEFVIDESMHKFFMTFNPFGYLKRL